MPRQKRQKQVLCDVLCGFLLPEGYGGHEHEWLHLDIDFCVCRLCGKEHACTLDAHGECIVEVCDNRQRVCTLTGYVLSTTELCLEWGGTERVCFENRVVQKMKQAKKYSLACALPGLDLVEQVHQVVAELLQSERTVACAQKEAERKVAKQAMTFMKIMREHGRDHLRRRPCMLYAVAQMHWAYRKVRTVSVGKPCLLESIVQQCTENITCLLQTHGWVRVQKQLSQHTRRKEFICSMLYLMRMGITYRQRCLLPCVPELELLLPQQIFLPTVFDIRSKSITEGENIMKLDIRRCPLN